MATKTNEPVIETLKPREEVVSTPQEYSRQPLTIMTESDAYISERMKEQPKTLDDIDIKVTTEKPGIHRLTLPDYFEPLSYDCTSGVSCPHHGWVESDGIAPNGAPIKRWNQSKRGKYIFRWLNKNKRALDHSMNVRGYFLANRSFFKDAPKILFGVNGGVENGDSILGFLPVAKALEMREKPSRDSIDRIRSEETKHEGHPNFYKAKISSDVDGRDDAPADARQEGRDF
jgi:hypothetical protein